MSNASLRDIPPERREVFQKNLDEVMDWFDFNSVAASYIAIGFGWVPEYINRGHDEGQVCVKLRQDARDYLARSFVDAFRRGHACGVGSGGLEATAWPCGNLKLVAIIDSWHTEDSE